MKTQQQLSNVWNIVSQWFSQIILSPIVRRYALYAAIFAFAFVCYLLGTAAFHLPTLSFVHTQVIAALHQLSSLPFATPWP